MADYAATFSGVSLIYPDRKFYSVSGTLIIYTDRKYGPSASGGASVDSTNTVIADITNWAQRAWSNIGDLTGLVYNTAGGAVTLSGVRYSLVGPAGPWAAATVYPADPLYDLPNGDAAGQPFDIPVEIPVVYTGSVWFELTINTVLGAQVDIDGPFSYIYVSPIPPAPAAMTIPAASRRGDILVSWIASAAPFVDYYRVQQATQADYSDAQDIYTGSDLSVQILRNASGFYYYRVLSGRLGYGESAWFNGLNFCEVLTPGSPLAFTVPENSRLGIFLVSWAPVASVDFYELQEATKFDFSDAHIVYTGVRTTVRVQKAKAGTFYYRVRSGVNQS